MKSRLAVSVLFILIVASFKSDAIGAFEKLRSWAGEGYDRSVVQVWSRIVSHSALPLTAMRRGDGKSGTINVLNSRQEHAQAVVVKLAGSDHHSKSCDFVAKAAQQIHGVLGLMGIK